MAYIGTSPSNGVRRRFVYEATASQTSFSGNDENGIALTYVDSLYLDVYQNGIKLKAGDDYTATTGTTVVLVQGASLNDVVEMVAFDVFSVNDSVSASDGGSFAGNIGMGGTLAVTGVTTGTIIKGTTSLQTPLIEFTDGDDAIAIADGGVVTMLTTAVAKSEGGAVTTNITQGVAKAWFHIAAGNAGTIALGDSFNATSITDGGTGTYNFNIANDMGNAVYSLQISSQAAAGFPDKPQINSQAAGSFQARQGTASAAVDSGIYNATVNGDLA